MIKSTVKPTSTKPSKPTTKPAAKPTAKPATSTKPATPTKPSASTTQPQTSVKSTPSAKTSTPVNASDKSATPKPVTKETPKPVESTTPVKPPVKQSPKPVEQDPVKPVKEAAKDIDTKVMKEKQDKAAADTKPSTETIKANGKKANPGAKTTANATETPPKSDITTPQKKDAEEVVFAWTPEGAETVQICGSFNDWKDKLDMKNVSGKHQLSIPLKPGKYSYKFIVDGEWCYDFTAPNETDEEGNVNNVISV